MNAGPSWVVPMEVVRALAVPSDCSKILKLTLTDEAIFAPHAVVTLRDAGFVAEVGYEVRAHPGHKRSLPVLLAAVSQENASGKA